MKYINPLAYGTKKYSFSGINTSNIEIRDLAKAWIALSFAFAILLNRGLSLNPKFFGVFIVSAFTVGIGFLLHEIGHKIVAQRYGCFAEFRSFDPMLLLAIFFSFFGFIFAAPGAVMISGKVNSEKNGRISAAGPIVNIILALIFLAALKIQLIYAFKIGLIINSIVAAFNMIPIGNFDGRKILAWNKAVYLSMVAMSVGLIYFSIGVGWI